MRGLYAIVDTAVLAARGIDPLAFAEAVLVARPAFLQLRAKNLAPRETLGLLRALVPMCRRAKVPLVANDRADLAVLAGCDLVHVGQGDAPVDLVRRIAPNIGIGVSTHTPDQLAIALAVRPAYVAYGPVFATHSKAHPDPVVGLEGLAVAAHMARAAGVPLVAIGGIDEGRARDVARSTGIAAVIAALLPEPRGADEAIDFGAVTRSALAFARLLAAEGPSTEPAGRGPATS